MSDEVFIDHDELRTTQSELEKIASDPCKDSAKFVENATFGQDQRQWGTEQAAVLYRNKLASQLRNTESEIQHLRKRIAILAERIEEARNRAEATDNEIAEVLSQQQNAVVDATQSSAQTSAPPQATSFTTWN